MAEIAVADNVISNLALMLEEAKAAREALRKSGVPSAKYVTAKKFCELTGYTDKAVRGKISAGVWLEGQEFIHAPDNRILINMEAYDQWVMGSRRAVNQ